MKLELILLLLAYQSVAANEDYFKKSIFNALKDKNGQFIAELDFQIFGMEQYKVKNELVNSKIKEKYSFALNVGERIDTRSLEFLGYPTGQAGSWITKYLFLNSTEIYAITNIHQICTSFFYDNDTVLINSGYASFSFENNGDQSLKKKSLNPRELIEILYEEYDKDKKNVKCVDDAERKSKKNPKRCSVMLNETIKLEYDFADRAEHTMYPEKIEGFAKNQTTSDWQIMFQFVYFNFTTIFNRDPIVSTNIPIGFGCKRLGNLGSYPMIESNYANDSPFELEQEVVMSYDQKASSFEDEFPSREWRGHNSRTYANKMYLDPKSSLNIAETIDEGTNKSIRTIYHTNSHLLHSVSLEDNECITYNLTSNQSFNWFYIQDSFVKRPELYHMKADYSVEKRSGNLTQNMSNSGNYTYLGEYNVGDVPCEVFEKRFYYESAREELVSLKALRENINKISPYGYLVSTQYYPKDPNHWSSSSKTPVPLRVEIRLNGRMFFNQELAFLAVNFKSVNSSPKKRDQFDSSKCKIAG